MQVVIPLAGKGTRLRPHTHVVPKPLIRVAGRPVLDWVMDRLDGLAIEELIFITGHLKEQVEAYARARYGLPSRFVEQRVQDGTAGAVHLARPFVHGPVLIVFADTIFDADLGVVKASSDDGIIWTKEVDDYQRFGVVVTDAAGYMTRIVEKPREPVSRLANIGLHYVRDAPALWQGIEHVLASPKNRGEWYLTDAFQWMIEHGRRIRTAEVAAWYDCGAMNTVLETNRILLERAAGGGGAAAGEPGRRRTGGRKLAPGVTLIEPLLIEEDVVLEGSTVGPNVCIEAGTVVRDSTLANAIVGKRCRLERVRLDGAMLGDEVVAEGLVGRASLGAHAEVRV
ncbi:MAG: NTP transferase domain-containing protein [Gemmatimonadetes bacterium]|nr:NTP transferase domain-containing protein [Gemmatimonadota bacterium]